MTEKSKEMGEGGGGGGGGGGRERKRVLSFGIRIHGGGKRGDPTLEKEEGFRFQTSRRMNGKTRVPGGKTH